MERVVIEEERKSPVAVIYHGGSVAAGLGELLTKEKLRVVTLTGPAAALPAWEKPDHVFFFASKQGREADLLDQWTQATGKKILILENWEEAPFTGADLTVRIRGRVGPEEASKIVKFAFGPGGERELRLFGKGAPLSTKAQSGRSAVEILANLGQRPRRPVGKRAMINFLLMMLVFLLVAPFVVMGWSTIAGFSAVVGSVAAIRQNDLGQARRLSQSAQNNFLTAKAAVSFASPLLAGVGGGGFVQRYESFLEVGERSADLADRAGGLLPKMTDLVAGVLSGQKTVNQAATISQIRLELDPMNADLGFIEGRVDQFLTPRMVNILSFFGVSGKRVANYKDDVAAIRGSMVAVNRLLGIWDEVVPKQDRSKTYLVVFQNSAELRPTGGFIGSYALVTMASGRLIGFKIYDIYAADGQLRGNIAPPDEILHFLGQPSWFMRDANFSPDWPLTARRLEWFLEKETGIKADGVIGINLGAVQKMLVATGPITLANGETVTADNFFEKAEYAAEINFFPGSTQKSQYLSQVAQALLGKITSGGNRSWSAMATA
ncbi:DUF4012 domain-containing protein, partial [Candidatus Microgenomates bacterium]|nr:DUF4012 domain-containing protein [Candidatus Microgenomates bacterium]